MNLSRNSSGRARSRGLRSPHSKRLGSLEPTICSLGWFYADTDLRPGPPIPAALPSAPLGPPTGSCPAVAPAAHRARGLVVDVTGKVSNSGARPPETGFTLSRVTERSAYHCCAVFSLSLLLSSLLLPICLVPLVRMQPTCTARCIRLAHYARH